jgi:hypothetical protein
MQVAYAAAEMHIPHIRNPRQDRRVRKVRCELLAVYRDITQTHYPEGVVLAFRPAITLYLAGW